MNKHFKLKQYVYRIWLVIINLIILIGNTNAQPIRDSIGNIYEIKDVDGNIYKIIGIGPQIWMSENLKVTHYSNGDQIPIALDSLVDNTSAFYCNYNNDSSISKTFGKLYNWPTVIDSRNICPIGWHVPTNEDWIDLLGYLGGFYCAGEKLKSVDSSLWIKPNLASGKYNFAALPSGCRNMFGEYRGINIAGYWWSSSMSRDLSAKHWYHNRNWVWRINAKESGLDVIRPVNDGSFFSVRCVKDY